MAAVAAIVVAGCSNPTTADEPSTSSAATATDETTEAAQAATGESEEAASEVPEVCGQLDAAASLAALGLSDGKLEPATVGGGKASSIKDAAGTELAKVAHGNFIEMGAPDNELTGAVKAMEVAALEAIRKPGGRSMGTETVDLDFMGRKQAMPMLIVGWGDGAKDGQISLSADDEHVLVRFAGVEEAQAVAFMREITPTLVKLF